MKTWLITIAIIIVGIIYFTNCKKATLYTPPKPVIEKDISTLTLPELKNLLSGNWKLVYTWGFYPGYKYYNNTYINFYNFADSIKWVENGITTIKTNATYTKIRNYFSGDSTYLIYHLAIPHNTTYDWSAEYMRNDTLVLMDQGSNPESYYLVR